MLSSRDTESTVSTVLIDSSKSELAESVRTDGEGRIVDMVECDSSLK